MTNGNATSAGLAASLLIILFMCGVYDIWATFYRPPGYTVSALVQRWSVQFPVLPFLIGVLAGHIFWPVKS